MTFICIYYVSHETVVSFDLSLKNLFFYHNMNQGNVHCLKSRHKLKLHGIHTMNSLDTNAIYVLFTPNLVYRLDIQFYVRIIWDQYVYKFVLKIREYVFSRYQIIDQIMNPNAIVKIFTVESLTILLCGISLYNGNFTAGNVSKK